MKEAKTGYPVVEKTSINYAITVTNEEMLKILRKDNELILEDDGKTLFDLLDALPYIIEVEYEGMFGPHIHIEFGVEDDTIKNWREILSILENYLKVVDDDEELEKHLPHYNHSP